MILSSESLLEIWAKFCRCAESLRERPRAAPGDVVAGGVLFRLRMLARLRSAGHHASGDACSRQSIEKYSTRGAGGMAALAGRLRGASASRARPQQIVYPTSHQTVARFYAETAREEPLNGKRRVAIYLASGEDVTSKAGRPKGSTKAVRAAAEGRAVAVPPPAAVGLGAGAASARAWRAGAVRQGQMSPSSTASFQHDAIISSGKYTACRRFTSISSS